jgi:hypothetical protein
MMAARDAEVAYQRAFEEFARSARALQVLKANPNTYPDQLRTALAELERARSNYNHARDEWAAYLLHSEDSYRMARHDEDEDRLCAAHAR